MEETTRKQFEEDNMPSETLNIETENKQIYSNEEMTVPKTENDEDVSHKNNDTAEEDDYQSVGSESDISDRSGSESGDVEEEDDASVILEREEGDGQESTPNRKVDDDEDKRNPQYIPKRGTFYEHDDRTAVEEEAEAEAVEENERSDKDASKKKVWSEKESSRWSHDRYNDQEQAPKSRTELVSIYGYDIRNEDGPPRARRRRRYGRGPNKYTRNWEDEDAYNKLPVATSRGTGRKKRGKGEDFPPLEGTRNQSRSSDLSDMAASGDSEQNKEVSNRSQDNGNRIDARGDAPVHIHKTEIPSIRNENGNYKPQKPVPKREIKEQREPRMITRTFKPTPKIEESNRGNTNSRGVTRTRGFRGGGRGNITRNQKPPEDNTEYIITQNFTNKNISPQVIQDMEKEMSNVSIQDGGYGRGGKFNGQRQVSVPPRLQAEQRGSKRYSSLRQRSLPETAGQQATFNQPHQVIHYPPEYTQQNPPQPNPPQGILPHPAPTIVSQVPTNSSQPIMTVQPSGQPMGPIPHQGPANGAPLLQAPPITAQYANPFPQGPPAFIQAGVAPPPFIPPQGMNGPPQIINYGQPPQFPQPDFANFQHQQFAAVNQPPPADVYQASQGGITYYSMQNQQIIPRVQAKRPKAAIPIVPPPEHKEPRGRGRLIHGEESPVGGTPDLQRENYEIDNNGMQYGGDVIVQQ